MEPRNGKQPIKFVSKSEGETRCRKKLNILFENFQLRKWPDLTLKSPGIKPRRHNQTSMSLPGTLPFSTKSLQSNNNNNNINNVANNSINNNNCNTSEGEQSPTGNASTISAAHEFSVFANVNIQGGSSSQATSNAASHAATDFSDTISLNSAMMAPELPKRSNSIISLPSNSIEAKPVLSPRTAVEVTALRSQPITSPKLLDAVTGERTAAALDPNMPPAISPRTAGHGYSHSYDATCSASSNRSPFQTAPAHRYRGSVL